VAFVNPGKEGSSLVIEKLENIREKLISRKNLYVEDVLNELS
jgi:hypothetical protein